MVSVGRADFCLPDGVMPARPRGFASRKDNDPAFHFWKSKRCHFNLLKYILEYISYKTHPAVTGAKGLSREMCP